MTVETAHHVLAGEHPGVPERLIVAPATGVFTPLPPDTYTTEGEIVYDGQSVGTVSASGTDIPVRSRFTGFLMGMLAHPGERVREGQPVAWVRASG
jgi:biotin carboxyl carrier protein